MEQQIIKQIIYASEKYGIQHIIGLNGKYLSKFYEDVVFFNVNERKIGGIERSGYYRYPSFLLKSLLYFVVTFLSSIKVYKYTKRIKFKETILNRVIYVSAAFKIVKARNLRDLLPGSSLYYYPLSDMSYIGNHISTFNSINQSLYVDRFKIRFVFKTFVRFIRNYKKLLLFSKEIDSIFETKYNDAIVLLLKAIYASIHYESFSKKLKLRQHVWLLEYQTGVEMLALQCSIKKERPLDITIHMQHGTMLDPRVIAYNDPITDYDIVCGEREVRILSEMNRFQSKLLGLGCPLQSMGYIRESSSASIKYDVLVLLTEANKQSTLNCQATILSKLGKQEGLKVLLRFRPASKTEDHRKLLPYIKNMDISDGTALDEDISLSNIVVTFSADALYHCFRQGRKSVLVVHEKYIEEEFNKSHIQSNNLKVLYYDLFDVASLYNMMSKRETIDYRTDAYVKFNFGNIDTISYKHELEAFLSSISC